MPKGKKKYNCLGRPSGCIPPSWTIDGVTYTPVGGGDEHYNNIMIVKDDRGNTFNFTHEQVHERLEKLNLLTK